MKHPIHRVKSFQQLGSYVLSMCFEDGSARTIDFEPILEGEVFGPLRDWQVFAQVKLDPEVHTLVWPSGADFDPAHSMIGQSMRQRFEPQRSGGNMQVPWSNTWPAH